MTARLYYTDCYLTRFTARVVESDPERKAVYLDQTAFYPTSGGQPHDEGRLGGVAVADVVDEGGRIAHILAEPIASSVELTGEIDWPRRFHFMQQHTGQHLLSAVLEELFGFKTVSVHFGADANTLDIATAAISPEQMRQAEFRTNEVVFENRVVTVGIEHSSEVGRLRKVSAREGDLRIVSIEGLDRSACGGTHVRRTGEIGPILIRRAEKIRNDMRIEFLCGRRAVMRSRADFEALSQIARTFSSTLDDAAALVALQSEQLRDAEKTKRKLAVELAQRQGRELYEAAERDAGGRRKYSLRQVTPLGDEIRTLAQSFTSQPNSVFIAASETPPSILFAVSSDSGLHAGNALKAALQAVNGRGGGNAQLGQGSVPDTAALAAVLSALNS